MQENYLKNWPKKYNSWYFFVQTNALILILVFQVIAVPSHASSTYNFSRELDKYISDYNKIFPAEEFHFAELNYLMGGTSDQAEPISSGEGNANDTSPDGAERPLLSPEGEMFLKQVETQAEVNRQVEALVRGLYQTEDARTFEMTLQEILYRYLVETESRRALHVFFLKVMALYYNDSQMRERLKEESFAYHYADALVPAGVATFAFWFLCARYPLKCKALRPDQIWQKWRLKFKIGQSQGPVMTADTIPPGRRLSPYLMEQTRQRTWRGRMGYRTQSDSGALRRQIDFRLKSDVNANGKVMRGEGGARRIQQSLDFLRAAEGRLSGVLQRVLGQVSERQTLSQLVAWTGTTFGLALPIAGATFAAREWGWVDSLSLDLQSEYRAHNVAAWFQLKCAVDDLSLQLSESISKPNKDGSGRLVIKQEELTAHITALSEVVGSYNFLLGVERGLGSPTAWPDELAFDDQTNTLLFRGDLLGACEQSADPLTLVSPVVVGQQISQLVGAMKSVKDDYAYWQSEQTLTRFLDDFRSHVETTAKHKVQVNIGVAVGRVADEEREQADLRLMRARVEGISETQADIPTAQMVEDFFRVQFTPDYTTREPRKLAKFLLERLSPAMFNELMVRALWTFVTARGEANPQRVALLALFNEISKELEEKRKANPQFTDERDGVSNVEMAGFLFAILWQQPVQSAPGDVGGGHFFGSGKNLALADFRQQSPPADAGDRRKQSASGMDLWEKTLTPLAIEEGDWRLSPWLLPLVGSLDEEQGWLWRYWSNAREVPDAELVETKKIWQQWVERLGQNYLDPFVVVGLAVQASIMKEACFWRKFRTLYDDTQVMIAAQSDTNNESLEKLRREWAGQRQLEVEKLGFVREVSDLARLLGLTFASVKAIDQTANPDSGAFRCALPEASRNDQEGSNQVLSKNGDKVEGMHNAWATLRWLSTEIGDYVAFLESEKSRGAGYQLKMP